MKLITNTHLFISPSMCPIVGVITGIAEVTIKDETKPAVKIETEEGRKYQFTLNQVLTDQLVRVMRTDETDEMVGRRLMVSTYEKGDKVYLSLAPAPVMPA